MLSKDQEELAKKLLQMDPETFKLAGEIFVNSDIKIVKAPVFKPVSFNLNILKEMNTAQLQFIFSLINQELEKRGT